MIGVSTAPGRTASYSVTILAPRPPVATGSMGLGSSWERFRDP